MTELRFVLVLLFVGSCMQSHDGNRQAIRSDDCVTCHLVDYDATSVPPHAMVPTATGTVAFPKTCGDCHRTTSWQPALGLHPPPPKFLLVDVPPKITMHDDLKCLGCHDLDLAPTSTGGANTNCLQCHPDTADLADAHVGTKGPIGQAYTYAPAVANFCLGCHLDGTARHHPNDKFPRTGPHATSCTSCHDRLSGVPDMAGMNTTCIRSGCHSLAQEDAHHREKGGARYTTVRGDGSNKHFCLDSGCHPDGRKHDR
jgi:hypothetical protein